MQLLKQTIKIITTEKEFKKILKITAEFYMRLDKEKIEKKMFNIIKKRSKIKNDKLLKEKDIHEFIKLVS